MPDLDGPVLQNTQPRFLRQKIWMQECERIGLGEQDHLEKYEQFWRTMLCDLTGIGTRVPAEYEQHFSKVLDLSHNSDLRLDKDWLKEAVGSITLVESSLHKYAAHKRFCTTNGGRFAQVPKAAEPDDLICILYGGNVPFVIRPREDGHYRLIGECYIHSFIDREAMLMEELKTQEFSLS
jgi:hypothetical protein